MLEITYKFVVLLALTFGIAASASTAGDVCALTIEIVGNKGEPSRAHVLVSDASSELVADVLTDAEGKAKICDLGFGEHHVEVNTPYCYSLFIDKVRFVYPHPLYFKLELPDCIPPEEGAVVGTGCAVYLRVRSDDGKPVGGATVKFDWNPEFQEKTDGSGRLQTVVPLGDAGSLVTALSPGFEPTQVRVRCGGHMYREQLIVLEKRK